MHEKEKLLFVCNNLHIGGIQRSLVNLLDEISDKYDITLFLFYPAGEYKLPDNVKTVYGNKFVRIMGMSQSEAAKEGAFTKMQRAAFAVLTRIIGCKIPFKLLCRCQKLPGEFDVAISFMQNSSFRSFYGGCNEFVVNSVKAKRKISFVHCDFEHYFGNNKYNREYYKHFDAIACVSDSCKEVFDRVCPEFAGRTQAVHNCFNYEHMRKTAEEFKAEYSKDKINIFTSARISREKGILRMMSIFSKLKSGGCGFVWRIAGDGPEYESAAEECKRLGLEKDIVFLGLQKNPYPYFKAADLVLVPSYDEAAPMVYGEAMTFGKPVFTTDTVSARELVEKKKAGFVCENSDYGIQTELERILKNPEEIKKINYSPLNSNAAAIEEFENIVRRGKQ